LRGNRGGTGKTAGPAGKKAGRQGEKRTGLLNWEKEARERLLGSGSPGKKKIGDNDSEGEDVKEEETMTQGTS